MLKETTKLLLLLALLLASGVGILFYYNHTRTARRIAELEAQARVLEGVITRLNTERRVAEILVTDQQIVGGVKTTTLLFVEYARPNQTNTDAPGAAPNTLPPKTFTVRGEYVHIDAQVIKFDHALVKADDPFKGKSIALFTKIYGDATPPEQGALIDPKDAIPQVYQGADPKITDLELKLWKDFWTLAYDDTARTARGVRALIGQGLWEPLRPGTLYTVTLETNGGLSLTREPLKGIYRELLAVPPPKKP